MISKRGQVAVFILLGTFLLVIIGLVLYVSADKKNKMPDVSNSFDIKIVTNFVEQCLEETSNEAIEYVAERGGYYTVPEESVDGIPYYLYREKVFIPSRDEVEKNIGHFVSLNLAPCLDFSVFRDVEVIIQPIQKVTVTIGSGVAITRLEMSMVFRDETKSIDTDDFSVSIPTPFLSLYEHARKIVQNQKNSTTGFCMSCDMLTSEETGFITESISSGDESVYIVRKEGASLLFRFAVKK